MLAKDKKCEINIENLENYCLSNLPDISRKVYNIK